MAEWGCQPPAYNERASASDEAECDRWCARLAQNLGEPIPAPEHLRPWILARLVSAAGDAYIHDRLSDIPCPALTPQNAAQYLVAEWHHALRERWRMFDGESFAE